MQASLQPPFPSLTPEASTITNCWRILTEMGILYFMQENSGTENYTHKSLLSSIFLLLIFFFHFIFILEMFQCRYERFTSSFSTAATKRMCHNGFTSFLNKLSRVCLFLFFLPAFYHEKENHLARPCSGMNLYMCENICR